jgi:hypothetical protein
MSRILAGKLAIVTGASRGPFNPIDVKKAA